MEEEERENIYQIGRLTALVEELTDMPHRVVPKIASSPFLIVRPWLSEAVQNDKGDRMMDIMPYISDFPTSLPLVTQMTFWAGYYKQQSKR